MANKIMTARYPGTCGDCQKAIVVGTQINYGGKGAVSHEACKPQTASTSPRRSRGSYGNRRSTYRTYYRCTHEDYPCCGCDADSR